MGARSKKLWIEISGENTGRSFGGESITQEICVGTSGTNSKKICKIRISSWEREKDIYYDIIIDDQKFKQISFNRKTKEYSELEGNMICGDPQYLKAKENKEESSILKMVGAIASMGEIFCNSKKEKNDWKLRMLKAGLDTKGLSIPDDWDSLSEEEKEKRLNNVTNELLK